VLGEGSTPHRRALAAGKEDPSHAVAASVCGALHGVSVSNEFGQACGTVFKGENKVAEAGKVGSEMA
jgi:hypothetical protein